MKLWILTATIIVALTGGCNKATTKNCVKAKVLRIRCPSTVIQVLDNDKLGEDGWIDIKSINRDSYDNVFNLGNKCDLPYNLTEGEIIWFTIDSPTGINCIICNDYDAPPNIWYDVKNVSSKPCQFN